MPDAKKTFSIPTWLVIVAFCFSCASAAWALSTEVHNYRVTSLGTRTNNHETAIQDLRAADAERDVILGQFSTELTNVVHVLDEVRADVKELLRSP